MVWIYSYGDTVGIFLPNPNTNYAQLRVFNGGREYFFDVWTKKRWVWNSIRDKIKLQLSAKVREIEEYANREP